MPEVVEVPTLAENESGYRDFDTDDVSLRLRLLVNNSYFLPPAHSKPTIADLSNSDAARRSPKPTSPGFFDIFRIGKTKSKPPTPVALEPPRLRATSESSTQLDVLRDTNSTPGASTTPQKPVEIPARVVVVREKMEDLMIAAKQAEQESKIRAERALELQERNLDQTGQFDGIIDPTDAVDLPPPSTKYPFAIQASATQGLGVNDSIGAAFLADRLPPPRSPGLWSVTEEDEKWRKLLLTQAVGHSLSNTPDSWASRTPVRRPPRSTSIPDTTPRSPLSPTPSSPTPKTQILFSEPILLPDALRRRLHSPSLSYLTPPSPKSQVLHLGRKNSAPDIHNVPGLSPLAGSSYDPPVRAETPVAPTFPLSPAPRAMTTGPGSPGVKHLVNPIYSLSQSDLGDGGETGVGSPSSSPTTSSGNYQTSGPSVQEILSDQQGGEELRTVQSILAQAAQKAQSTRSMKSARSVRSLRQPVESEKLPDVQEDEIDDSGRDMTSPPPTALPVTTEHSTVSPRHTLGASSEAGTSSQFDEEDTEEWFGLHDDSGSRDSSGGFPRTRSMLSYLAPPSPTVSAFHDALEGRRDSESSPTGADTDVGASSGPETFVTADTRASVYSPPPRQSTSIPPQPLPPPPRRRPRANPGPRRPSTLRQEPITIWEPEPSTPPLPSLSGEPRGTGFSLDLPHRPERGELSRAMAEEAAQGNARMSISFFDDIQSDLKQLDESSSSEEESETDSDVGEAFEAPVFRNPDTQAISIPGRRSISSTTTRPARPALMRLGNNSTPQLGSSTSSGSSFNQIRHDYPVFDPISFRGPVGNTPTTPTTKSSFFTSRTPKKQKQQGVSSEDYHGPRARSFEDGVVAGPSTSGAGSIFLDMESEKESSELSHGSQEAEEVRKSQDESTKILDGLVLQHLEKERDTIKRITESNRPAKSKR